MSRGIFNTDMSYDEATKAYFREYDNAEDKQKLYEDYEVVITVIMDREAMEYSKYGTIR